MRVEWNATIEEKEDTHRWPPGESIQLGISRTMRRISLFFKRPRGTQDHRSSILSAALRGSRRKIQVFAHITSLSKSHSVYTTINVLCACTVSGPILTENWFGSVFRHLTRPTHSQFQRITIHQVMLPNYTNLLIDCEALESCLRVYWVLIFSPKKRSGSSKGRLV